MKESVIQGEPPRTVRRRLWWSRRILKAFSVCRQGRGQGQNSPEFPSAAGGSGDGGTEKPSEM